MQAIKEEDEEEHPGLSDRTQFEQGLLKKMAAAPLPKEEEKKESVFTSELPAHLD